ncbi:MFS transporter [Mesorhizobium sp. AD1-1]|uniref:MFS transporter n=1 Tax=Mesorhizobium sp. AD1-1 TaxID=2876621 RepID=UPI001CCAEB56|nr:MFS transporter [Mesorhizobium sp. AD1-1]MBZ9719202.1 MFS transporter [Mesorhizobium sp. AD1-1]
MSPSNRYGLLGAPGFAVAAIAMFLAVTAQAMASSYMTLLAVERAGMSPFELGLFLTLSGISSIGATSLFARTFDSRPRLCPLALPLALAALGYSLCTVIVDRWALMIVAFLLLGPATASFALICAVAKGGLDQRGSALAAQGMAALRMIASLSWVIGPALGAFLIHVWSYAGVYGVASSCSLAAFVALFAFRPPMMPAVTTNEKVRPIAFRWAIQAALALTFFNIAMFMGSTALSIVVVNDLDASERDVGLMFSLCAAVEVIVMALFVLVPAKRANRSLLVAGFAVFSLYFLSVALLPMLQVMYGAQVLRAVGIGIISVGGMQLLQELNPGRAGTASALFANTTNAGWLVAGIATGTWAELFGYHSVFGLCAALSFFGGVLVVSGSSLLAAETKSSRA